VPTKLIIGNNEVANQTITLKDRSGKEKKEVKLESF
jgi:threonyl-tRNA synthetase